MSCTKEEVTYTFVKLTNGTKHKVKLLSYYKGVIDSSKIKEILPSESDTLEINSTRGKNNNSIYWFTYYHNVDSIQVIWNDSFLVTHMISDSFYSTNKFIQFSILGQNRNLGSGSNYVEKKIKENKWSITWNFEYTFTEQDYNFAKD